MKAEDKPNQAASLNRHTLVDVMTKLPGYYVNKRDTYYVIDAMLRVMRHHIDRRGAIKLAKFGTFKLLYRAPRTVHNPRAKGVKQGKKAQIKVPGHYALRFIPSRHWYAEIKKVAKP